MCITNTVAKGIFLIVMTEEKGCWGIYISVPRAEEIEKVFSQEILSKGCMRKW